MDPSDVTDDLDMKPMPLDHEKATTIHQILREGKDSGEILDEHLDLIQEIDPISALKRLTAADIANSLITNIDISDDGAGLPPAAHNYLIGLIFAHGSPYGEKEVSYEDLAGPVLDLSYKSLLPTDVDHTSDDEQKLKSQVKHALKQQVFMAGEWMYSDQPLESATRAYSPHNSELKNILGFTIEEAIQCSDYIEQQLAKKRKKLVGLEFTRILSDLAEQGHTIDVMQTQLDKENLFLPTSQGKDFKTDATAIEMLYNMSKNISGAFMITHEELLSDCPRNIDETILEAYLERFSDPLGNVNSNSEFRWPYQFNPVSETPLIRISDRYYSPNGDLVRSALMKSPYYDLISMDGYGDPSGDEGGEFGQIFGAYLEDWVYDCMMKLYGEDKTYKRVFYPDGANEACDVLVLGDDTLFVIECKVGKIPIHLRNSDFDTIQESIQDKIGEGYEDQAIPLIKKLRDENLDKLVTDGKNIHLGDYSAHRPIIVVGEPYDSLSTHLIDVVIEMQDVSPYVTDVFSLQTITEFFDSEDHFEGYIENRMELFDMRAIMSGDEIDYLGLYYLNDCKFPEMEENNFLWIEDMGYAIGEEIDFEFGR